MKPTRSLAKKKVLAALAAAVAVAGAATPLLLLGRAGAREAPPEPPWSFPSVAAQRQVGEPWSSREDLARPVALMYVNDTCIHCKAELRLWESLAGRDRTARAPHRRLAFLGHERRVMGAALSPRQRAEGRGRQRCRSAERERRAGHVLDRRDRYRAVGSRRPEHAPAPDGIHSGDRHAPRWCWRRRAVTRNEPSKFVSAVTRFFSHLVPGMDDIRTHRPILAPIVVAWLFSLASAYSLWPVMASALPADAVEAVAGIFWAMAVLAPLVILAKAGVLAVVGWAVLMLVNSERRLRPLFSVLLYGEAILADAWRPRCRVRASHQRNAHLPRGPRRGDGTRGVRAGVPPGLTVHGQRRDIGAYCLVRISVLGFSTRR